MQLKISKNNCRFQLNGEFVNVIIENGVFFNIDVNHWPLVYVDIELGIHKVKYKVARNEKRKKLHGFSYV